MVDLQKFFYPIRMPDGPSTARSTRLKIQVLGMVPMLENMSGVAPESPGNGPLDRRYLHLIESNQMKYHNDKQTIVQPHGARGPGHLLHPRLPCPLRCCNPE